MVLKEAGSRKVAGLDPSREQQYAPENGNLPRRTLDIETVGLLTCPCPYLVRIAHHRSSDRVVTGSYIRVPLDV